jgi:hypothetical protein
MWCIRAELLENNKLENIWKVAILAEYEVLSSRNLFKKTDERYSASVTTSSPGTDLRPRAVVLLCVALKMEPI